MIALFALGSSKTLAGRVAEAGGWDLCVHEERRFGDGEHKFRPLVPVRGADAYVFQDLAGGSGRSVNDALVELLFFLRTLRDAGAARLTAVLPYLAYARKDRRTKPRDPLTTRYVAELLEAVGTDRVIAMEVHNLGAFENAFRCETLPLDPCRLFAGHLGTGAGSAPLVIASPDPGGVKRAQIFRDVVQAETGRQVGFAFADKRRSSGVVSGELIAGDVAGADVVILDDMIVSGGTVLRAAKAFVEAGAKAIDIYAAHGLFGDEAETNLLHPAIRKVVTTDTVPATHVPKGPVARRIEIITAAPVFADAIGRLHGGGGVSALRSFPA